MGEYPEAKAYLRLRGWRGWGLRARPCRSVSQRPIVLVEERMTLSPYHAKYFAYELTRRAAADGLDRLSQSLFDACVDLSPHQIEAALFALRSPLSTGVLLADEVGLARPSRRGWFFANTGQSDADGCS